MATVLATGHCLYCLQPLSGGGEKVETGKILGLSEFDRVRSQVRRSKGRKAMRSTGAGLVGVIVGAILVGLFYFGMQWLTAFFGKGTSWRQ